MKATTRNTERLAKSCHRPDPRCFAMKANFISSPSRSSGGFFICPVPPSAWRPHGVAALSPPARASSGHGPGKASRKSAANSRAHLRSTFSWTSRSRVACTTLTLRSRTNLTASSLYSRLNFLRCIDALRSRKTPYLAVHQTGSSSPSDGLSARFGHQAWDGIEHEVRGQGRVEPFHLDKTAVRGWPLGER